MVARACEGTSPLPKAPRKVPADVVNVMRRQERMGIVEGRAWLAAVQVRQAAFPIRERPTLKTPLGKGVGPSLAKRDRGPLRGPEQVKSVIM